MQTDFLRLTFSDIIQGYSKLETTFGLVFIKHFNSLDFGELESENKRFYEQAKRLGIPTLKEREEYIKKEDLWTPADETEEARLLVSLNTMNLSKTKLIKEIDRKNMQKVIDEVNEELKVLRIKKNNLIGNTCESYSAQKFNQFCLFNSFFNDKNLTTRRFTTVEFDNLEEEELEQLTNIYLKYSEQFSDKTFKKIALSPFFLNLFYLAEDDPVKFYGRAIIYLTFYQSELFGLGKYFKPILAEWHGKLTDDILSDPDKLIEMANTNKNADEMLKKTNMEDGKTTRTSIVGASRKELEALGGQIVDFSHLVKDKPIATFQDVIKSHGL